MEMRGKHTREASAVSDSSGQFEVRVPFNLISDGAPSGDVCKGQLEQVSLRVSRLGYQPRKQAIKVTGERITANLALTPITVEPAIQELQR